MLTRFGLFKRFILISLFAFVLLGIFVLFFFLPSFLFNELEFQLRVEFGGASQYIAKADAWVSIRQAGPTSDVSTQQYIDAGKGIEQETQLAIINLKNAEGNIEKQENIPLLSKKYKIYREMDKAAMLKYEQYTEDVLVRLKNQHMLTDTTLLLMDTDQAIRDTNEDAWWKTMDNLPNVASTVASNAAQLRDNKFISNDLFEYFIAQHEQYLFLYTQSQKVRDSGDWSSFDKKFPHKPLTSDEITDIFSKSDQVGTALTDQENKEFLEGEKMLEDTSHYYDDHHLAEDGISVLLGVFSRSYPKMRVEGGMPIYVPKETDPDSVSMVIYPSERSFLCLMR